MTKMISDRALLDTIYRGYFTPFFYEAFKIISPGEPLQENWHIDATCEYLQAMVEGRKPKRLVLNMPPRSLKTSIVCACLPAWLLVRNPSINIIVVSYSDEMTRTSARVFRTLIESPFIARLSNGQLAEARKSTEAEYETFQSGGRFATSVGGTLTGRGADVLIIDDPIKTDEAVSDTARRNVRKWFINAAYSRLNHPEQSLIILSMQRAHQDDLAGNLIARGWPSLVIPALSREKAAYDLGGGQTYVREAGTPLQPNRAGEKTIEETRREVGDYVFNAQYLQDPVPLEGNLVKRDCIKRYDKLPDLSCCQHIYLVCDPSGASRENNDYTAIVVAAVIGRDVYILDVRRGHWSFSRIKQEIEGLVKTWHPTKVLIETTGLGEGVRQEIVRENQFDIKGFQPRLDKVTRYLRMSGRFDNGHVYLPNEAPSLGEFEIELFGFPETNNDDMIDAFISLLEDLTERENSESDCSGIELDVTTFYLPNPFAADRFSNLG